MIRWFDIAILAFLALPLPVMAVLGYRKLVRQLAEGNDSARLSSYRLTILQEWLTVAVLLVIWIIAGRSLEELGFTFSSSRRFWLGTGLSLVAAAIVLGQTITTLRNAAALERFGQRVRHVADLLPHGERELRTYNALAVTAGICEEIVYRGYVMWALATVGGIWWALAGSTILFSLGHLYQGTKSLASVFLLGLAFGSLFLLAGSIWAPIVLHIAVDLSSGRMGHAATKASLA